jgi:hypothetical protein
MFGKRMGKPLLASAALTSPLSRLSAGSAASADNSAGFSATIGALAEHLGDDAEQFESDSLDESKNQQLLDLRLRAEEWENSRLELGAEAREWVWYDGSPPFHRGYVVRLKRSF